MADPLLLDPAVNAAAASTDLTGVRVAIVTYELVGLTRTGGIGTAYTALAHGLAGAGAEVDVLFTGRPNEGVDRDAAVAGYRDAGVAVHLLDPTAADGFVAPLEHARRAQAAHHWLRARHDERAYAVVHMPECAGHGSAIAAAARAGVAFGGATIVTGTHGSSRWVRELNEEPSLAPWQLALEALEQRSVQDADVVLSPSAYLVRDMQARGWQLPERTFVQQYLSPPAASPERPARRRLDAVRELVFFGRLERRKGFVLFLDALDRLADGGADPSLRVTFLGRADVVDGRPADELVAQRRGRWPWDVHVLTDLDQPEALDYLQGPDRLAVMPSLADNLPLTVLEALGLGIPFLTARTGGIPEMIDARDLDACSTEADPDALADALAAALAAPPSAPRPAVARSENRDAWLRWHRAAADAAPRAQPAAAGSDDYVLVASPAHELDEDAEAVLTAAARRARADAVVFPVHAADGGAVVLPLGGPPSLAPFTNVMSTGSALVRRELLDGAAEGARGLEGVLAGAVADGRRLLVFCDPVGREREPAGRASEAFFAWWPDLARQRAAGAAVPLGEHLPRILCDLPAVSALAADELAAAWQRADEAEARVRKLDADWKDARAMVVTRDDELRRAETQVVRRDEDLLALMETVGRLEGQAAYERRRYEGLRNRRSVRAALSLARLRALLPGRAG